MTSHARCMTAVCGWACLLIAMLLLSACASRGPRPVSLVPDATLSEQRSKEIVSDWTQRLMQYIDNNGGGDPAVLTRLSALRATGTVRPSRITFGVLDVDASIA